MKIPVTVRFALPILFSDFVSAETQYGILGFGIPMYQPLCCYSCHDALSALYLECTTFSDDMNMHHSDMDMKLIKRMDMGGDSMATTSDACYASDRIWLETFSYCVHEKCAQDNVDQSEQSKCFSRLAANGLQVPTLQASLPSTAPTVQLETEATWLNSTNLVNGNAYLSNYVTMKEFVSSEERHTRYALVSMLFVVGICFIAGTWKRYITPKFGPSTLSLKINQHLLVPATLNNRHSSPLPYRAGYLPKRALSIFVTSYVLLNIVFSAVSFHHVTPNAWYADRRHEIAAYVSNRTGVLSFANLALAILFSGRNNLLIFITGWSQSTMLVIHRWASRVATVQAVVHSIIYTITYFWTDGSAAYRTEAAMPYYWWGIIATTVLCIAVCFAVLPIRIQSYEVFLISHIAFAILALVGCWYHIDMRFGSKWGYKVWLYIAFAFWAFDRLMRFFRLVFFNYSGSPIAVVKQIPHTDILQLTIHLKKAWKVRPSQHSFLYIPLLGKPWENHPFTIASWSYSELARNMPVMENTDITKQVEVQNKEIDGSLESHHGNESPQSDQVVCLIRARKGMTASLLQKLRRSGASSLPVSILTEGLYGGHRATLLPLKSADTILCVAGGIGITSCMSFLQQYVVESRSTELASKPLMSSATEFVLAWSAREESLTQHVSTSLLPDPTAGSQDKRLKYRFWCTGENSSQDKGLEQGTNMQRGRMNVRDVVRSVASKEKRVVVVLCAPGGMSDEAREAVVECLRDGMPVDLIEEAFAW
ncbi:hypothetical protein QM012_000807 [Aureobasidium pullulans]|uniref:FAD-binding FR-type domain-containing protein n=1 Tax=Aureobasidium pullulans TaxID=5580 RepID=A0ABR0TFR7_AURPU